MSSGFTLQWHGEKVITDVEKEVETAILKSAEHLKDESIKQAPSNIGDLKSNCVVDDSKLNSNLEVSVGYPLSYALKQHEELKFKHPKGGKAKFLEDPFNANIDKYTGFIADVVKKVTK